MYLYQIAEYQYDGNDNRIEDKVVLLQHEQYFDDAELQTLVDRHMDSGVSSSHMIKTLIDIDGFKKVPKVYL